MPNIGDTKRNDKSQKFIWVACEECGTERWNLVVRGKARNKMCRSCHARLSQPHIWENYQKVPSEISSKARQVIKTLIQKGVIKKKPCVLCGKAKSVAHHPDYDKPVQIVWLCQKHHSRIHINKID